MADGEDRYDRGSTLTVGRGLHIFRYVDFQGGGDPAVARLIAPGAGVTLLDMPGRQNGMLQRPGDCVVLRADRTSDVMVGLRRGSEGGSLDASFRLEPIVLAQDASAAEPRAAAPEPRAPEPRPVEAAEGPLAFLAHLANIGDKRFAQNVWAGGPDAPATVEGLQIVAPAGASPLEMQALVGARPARWTEWVGAGQFAGTRGHNLPLVGVRLRLKPEFAQMEIAAEALFLGSLVVAQTGRQIEFVSPTGVDPLVGVKFAIQEAQSLKANRGGSVSELQTRDREPRVRVFRASAAR